MQENRDNFYKTQGKMRQKVNTNKVCGGREGRGAWRKLVVVR